VVLRIWVIFSQYFTEKAGTYLWMAPEVFNSSPYDESVDIFSFAVVMWELLTLQRPYPGMKVSETYDCSVCLSTDVISPARFGPP
jgi:serine/threonine protein kinase